MIYRNPEYEQWIRTIASDEEAIGPFTDWLKEHGEDELAERFSIPEPEMEVKIDDYDWKEVFDYAEEPEWSVSREKSFPFQRRDVKTIIASQDGENDGPDWVMIGELYDGRFFTLRAGCDYTGWG